MSRIDDPSKGEMAALVQRIRDLERATPLNNASIGRNGLRVHSGGVITIENGGLKITGTAEVIGQLIGSGTITWTGPVNFTGTTTMTGTTNLDGPTNVDGALTINGATTITGDTSVTGDSTFVGRVDVTGPMFVSGDTDFNGTLDITGNTRIQGTTTLEDNLTLTGGGKITAGGVALEPTGGAFGGGRITSATGITISAPLAVFSGGIGVDGNASFAGTLSNTAMGTTTEASNVHVNSSGRFLKVTSASRFKLDTKPSKLPDALLDVPVKDWIDSAQAGLLSQLATAPRPLTEEQQAEWDASSYTRIPGVIAEEVEAAGGQLFVTYDTDGLIHGVAYDRFALARTQILADRLERALERITALEANR